MMIEKFSSVAYWWHILRWFQPVFRKTRFFKKAQPARVLLGFLALLGFRIFYLNEQLGSLLVDLAHQLSFCLDLPVL